MGVFSRVRRFVFSFLRSFSRGLWEEMFREVIGFIFGLKIAGFGFGLFFWFGFCFEVVFIGEEGVKTSIFNILIFFKDDLGFCSFISICR